MYKMDKSKNEHNTYIFMHLALQLDWCTNVVANLTQLKIRSSGMDKNINALVHDPRSIFLVLIPIKECIIRSCIFLKKEETENLYFNK